MDAAERKLVHCLEVNGIKLITPFTDKLVTFMYDVPQPHSPSVVLSIEQEVRANDGDANCHDAEDDQDQHHKTIYIINFVGPKGCEDKVPETQFVKTNKAKMQLPASSSNDTTNANDAHFLQALQESVALLALVCSPNYSELMA